MCKKQYNNNITKTADFGFVKNFDIGFVSLFSLDQGESVHTCLFIKNKKKVKHAIHTLIQNQKMAFLTIL